METYIIYRLTSPSNKSYIGYTSKLINFRFNQHIYGYNYYVSNKKYYGSTKLYKAFKKYGHENFVKEIIGQFQTKEEALQFEINMIKKYNSINEGYNIAVGGQGGSKPVSEETKLKMSIAAKGRILSEEHKENISKACKGKPLCESAKEKLKQKLINDNNIVFNSINEAATYYNTTKGNLSKWVKRNKFGLRKI